MGAARGPISCFGSAVPAPSPPSALRHAHQAKIAFVCHALVPVPGVAYTQFVYQLVRNTSYISATPSADTAELV